MAKVKLGFIGAGVMASAILEGVLCAQETVGICAEEIAVFDPITEKRNKFATKGVRVFPSEAEIFSNAETVVLAVKPQVFRGILEAHRDTIACKTVVSIMAGVKIATLKKYLPDSVGIIRVMPNMCLRVGKGMCAYTCSEQIKEGNKKEIAKVFAASGEVIELEEDKFDAVTAVSGSGPAYVFYLAKSMVRAGMDAGLSEAQSRKLALQTIEGAAVLAKQSEESLAVLVDQVCSKGGTTIEAIKRFDEGNLDGIVRRGMAACVARSAEMSAEII